jgi:hypothetical protein
MGKKILQYSSLFLCEILEMPVGIVQSLQRNDSMVAKIVNALETGGLPSQVKGLRTMCSLSYPQPPVCETSARQMRYNNFAPGKGQGIFVAANSSDGAFGGGHFRWRKEPAGPAKWGPTIPGFRAGDRRGAEARDRGRASRKTPRFGEELLAPGRKVARGSTWRIRLRASDGPAAFSEGCAWLLDIPRIKRPARRWIGRAASREYSPVSVRKLA